MVGASSTTGPDRFVPSGANALLAGLSAGDARKLGPEEQRAVDRSRRERERVAYMDTLVTRSRPDAAARQAPARTAATSGTAVQAPRRAAEVPATASAPAALPVAARVLAPDVLLLSTRPRGSVR